MEKEGTELPSADDAPAEIADDRRALVREVTPTTAWYYPAVALLAAIMVWAPATGSVGQFIFVLALCTIGLTSLESLRERKTGVTVSRPAGRRGWAILIAVGVVFIALVATSFALVAAGRAEFALLCAAVTFVAMLVLAWSYDASFRSEATHAR